MKYLAILSLLFLTSCYTYRKLEKNMPTGAVEFPVNKMLAYSSIDAIDSSDAYSSLAFQERGFFFPRVNPVGPKQLQFYYDGDRSLQVLVSDSPNKHIRDFKLYVKKNNNNHLILRPKFNCIPFFPFLFLVDRQIMIAEMLDDGRLVFLSRDFYLLSSPILNMSDSFMQQTLLEPVRDSI